MEVPYFLFHSGYSRVFCVGHVPVIICIVGLTYVYLAAVLLKQYIKKHWSEDEEGFENPVVASNEKVLT